MFLKRNVVRTFFYILFFAIIFGALSYAYNLFSDLAKDERQKAYVFTEILKKIKYVQQDELELYHKAIKWNTTIPILIYNKEGKLLDYKNLELSSTEQQTPKVELLLSYRMHPQPIEVEIEGQEKQIIYYGYSSRLEELLIFPSVLLFLTLLLLFSGYVLFLGLQESKQNSLWAGLSKETAHQLGTPISSLYAWIDLMKMQSIAPDYIPEIEKDVKRLEVISNRFSYIGSIPTLEKLDVVLLLQEVVAYTNSRSSKLIDIELDTKFISLEIPANKELLIWVFENLIRNAVDAIISNGKITISLHTTNTKAYIDVTDTGKGIPSKLQNKIFQPGYSTKKRGWGLGLSLTKRIIKDFHNGSIFVKSSEVGKTVFRIILPKNNKK